MTERSSALLTDLYQINMIQAYLDHGTAETAVFELFVRNLPARRGFLIAAGLEQALVSSNHCSFPAPRSNGSRAAGDSAQTSSIISPPCALPAMSMPCPKARCSSPTNRSCG